MGAFFPYNFHPTVYFIIWEMHGFPNQFHIVQENATKLIVWGEPGKSVLILFPYYGWFFSIRFPFYGILHLMGNACVFSLISHSLRKDSQNHRRAKFSEIGSRKYPTKPTARGKQEIGAHTFPIVWVLFSIRFTFYGILYNMWNTWISPSISHRWENAVKSLELGEPRKLVPIFSITYRYFSSIRFPFYGIFCYHRRNAWFFSSKSTLWPLWLFFHCITFSTCSKIYWFLKRKNKKTR